ncbi:hypothetical protein SAMN04487947_1862 [Halogeometricum rufum]|uniref:Uncharacterized protein n=1 Tax=Halogeometricum rufum TaxID=553469 RepID=A0A1I6GZ77_9EURY|nr:hypothetical protein [Halogeometricum rufum]SFR47512.1 hypothetical protein SAMN04487947_1862 [Halogeometricum rufum]
MIQCPRCSEAVPETRYCLNCETNLGVPEIPTRDPELTGRLSDAAAAADHESVAFRTLRSKHDQYDRPLGSYLFAAERPKRILDVDAVTFEGHDDETWKIRPGFRARGHAVVTDRRLLVVAPATRGDQLYELPFTDAVSVESSSSWLADALTVDLADGSSVSLAVSGLNDHERAAARDLLRERAAANDSAESRRAAFVRDADDVIADADDAATALRAAADLFDDREDPTAFDSHVAAADSVDDLFARLSESVGHDPASRPAGASDESDADDPDAPLPVTGVGSSALDTPSVDAPSLRRNLRRTLSEGDPKEAGKWAIGAGIAGFSVAVSLPFSTAAGLGAIALGGAATGAYASANPDSAAARIDPIEMAVGAKARGRRWERRGAPGGAAVGSAVGAAEHVAERATPSAYAHWYANVDPEFVLRGAELGARAADSSTDFENRTAAALLGGGFGLAYGYSDLDESAADLEALLDADAESVLPSGRDDGDRADELGEGDGNAGPADDGRDGDGPEEDERDGDGPVDDERANGERGGGGD